MKKSLLLLIMALCSAVLFAQNPNDAQKLVDEGIPYHDKGDYEGAITRYDKALSLDTNNVTALAEKALSLLAWGKYNESIDICNKAFETHQGEKSLQAVYVTCGNAYDELKKTDKSIKIYNEGITQFPNSYQLYFNKGVTLLSVSKDDEALACFEKSVTLNPNHAGSNNAIARLTKLHNKRIPSLLAYCRFFVLEPQSNRAKVNFGSFQTLINEGVQQSGKNSITVTINPNQLADTTFNAKTQENSFTSVDLILSMSTALNFDKKYKKCTDAENFIRNFSALCATLKECSKDNYGFFWNYYAPYFIEMNEKNLVETFGYIAYATSENEDVAKWLKTHKKELDEFYNWSENFVWAE